MSTPGARLDEVRVPYAFRTHQREALAAVDRAITQGRRRAWVVLPPGAGKTLVGLETARRLGRRTVVLGPNTAIQQQWVRGWSDLLPHARHPAGPGTGRDLETFFTALTYQSLATFLPDEEVDEEGDAHPLLARLHPNGRELVRRLRAEPGLTLVLDECHHLLEVWGRLLRVVLTELPNAVVLGLTATPPATMTREQQALVDELFGDVAYEASIPAVVREGHLAPFAELAWLTRPTPREADYVLGEAARFSELVHQLTDPAFGSVPFLEWLDRRLVRAADGPVGWHRLAKDLPGLCDAGLRLHHAGLLALPVGARVREEHRRPPTAEDWVLLVDDWLGRHLSQTGRPEDEAVVEAVRRALPSVGYRWTRSGIRRGRSPVDRVLARSEAKTHALVDIVSAEHRNLADRMRMLVLCDHERAAAALPVDLRGVMSPQAGSALLALEALVADPATRALHPLLVTGSTVAGAADTLRRLRALVAAEDPGLAASLAVADPGVPGDGAVARLEGGWASRTWVAWATRFFEEGPCQVLVGTRALLGEGWDAPAVTGLVDLTAATTPTAVVQARGRALRLDPRWADKVALTWSVVCVTDEHPKGGADWDRFVRKHDGFFGVDATGAVVDGVAHVDPDFSPYAPPGDDTLDTVNAAMVLRAEDRHGIAARWRVGEPYSDTLVHEVRVLPRRTRPGTSAHGEAGPGAAVVARPTGLTPRDDRPSPWAPHRGPVVAALVALVGLLAVVPLAPAILGSLAVGVLGQAAVAAARGRLLLEDASRPPTLVQAAHAVADALRAAGLSPLGATAVIVCVDEEGEYRCSLDGVPPEVSRRFATALDEVVSPMAAPRYVLPRYVVPSPATGPRGHLDGLRAAAGLVRPTGEVWHSVPSVLGARAPDAQVFADAWDRWVGGGPAVYTGSPEGEGVLVTHRGSDPFDATTVLRVHWR